MSRRKSAWDKKNRPSSQVQSVLINRNNFTKRQANAWIKEHGFVNRKVDITKSLYRYRQLPPGRFDQQSFRTKKIRDGVQLVIGIPLNKKQGSAVKAGSRMEYVGSKMGSKGYAMVMRSILNNAKAKEITRGSFKGRMASLPVKNQFHPRKRLYGAKYGETYHSSILPSGKRTHFIKYLNDIYFFAHKPFSWKEEEKMLFESFKKKKRGSGNIKVFGSMFKMPKTKIKSKDRASDAKKYTPVLKKIAENASKYYKTKVDWKFLRDPMKRGIAAWRTGHMTGANPFQWGYARVYSFLVGGKAFFTSETDVANKLPRKLYNKILREAVWSDTKTKPEKVVRDRDGRKINPRYYAGLTPTQRKARIKEINQRNRELKKYEKSGGKLTSAEKKKLNRPFKTDKFLKTKPSSYTVEARKRGIATSSKKGK